MVCKCEGEGRRRCAYGAPRGGERRLWRLSSQSFQSHVGAGCRCKYSVRSTLERLPNQSIHSIIYGSLPPCLQPPQTDVSPGNSSHGALRSPDTTFGRGEYRGRLREVTKSRRHCQFTMNSETTKPTATPKLSCNGVRPPGRSRFAVIAARIIQATTTPMSWRFPVRIAWRVCSTP